MDGEITENNMADMMGNMSPEEYAQQQALTRQQQMATLLMQQGTQQPQGQMVSGRYVPTSFFQNLVPIANIAASKYVGEKADIEQAKLAAAIRQNRNKAEQRISDLAFGTPAIPGIEGGIYDSNNQLTKETTRDMYGADMQLNPQYRQVAPVAGVEATKPDLASALREINTNMYGAGKEIKPLIFKQMMPEPTPEEKRFKAAVADGSWNVQKQGGLNSFLNQMSDKDKASLANEKIRLGYEAQRLGIAQQELAYNTGIGMPGMGGGQVNMGGGQGGQGNNAFAPKTVEPYQYNPMLSPKQNQEAAGKFAENQQKNMTNAKDSFDLMKEASKVLVKDVASSGRLSSIGTGIGEFFGADSKASQADAQLNMLSGALTMKQPRFEGPQGVLDVTLYQKLAGDLGNPNIPIPSRLATMKQMVNLQKKYYPGGDWDSIDTALKDTGKVSVGKPKLVYDPATGTVK
jgi:hypothetical protein